MTKAESPSYDTIYLEWEPPILPNGEVTHYMISYVAKPDILPKERNYCNERKFQLSKICLIEKVLNWNCFSFSAINYLSASVDKPIGDEESHSNARSSSSPTFAGVVGGSRSSSSDSETCSKFKCCECGNVQGNGTSKLPTDDSVFEKAAFENTIHNIIFVSNR